MAAASGLPQLYRRPGEVSQPPPVARARPTAALAAAPRRMHWVNASLALRLTPERLRSCLTLGKPLHFRTGLRPTPRIRQARPAVCLSPAVVGRQTAEVRSRQAWMHWRP